MSQSSLGKRLAFEIRKRRFHLRRYHVRLSRVVYLGRLWGGSHLWHGLLPGHIRPYAATLKLTENCQAKCVTCDYWRSKWNDGFSTDQAVALLNRLADFGIRSLRFTGGEPLMRRDFFEILQRANMKRFLCVELQTNGLLLKRYAEQINKSPITHVSVSIDGLESTNDAIRGVKGYFRTAFEGLKLLNGKWLRICTTITKKNVEELEELIEYARDIAGADFAFNLLDNRLYFLKSCSMPDLWPTDKQLETVLKIMRYRLRLPEYELDYFRKYLSSKVDNEPACLLGFIGIDVASNGDLHTGCLVLPPIGNLLKDDIATILKSKIYRDRCLAMMRRECPGCVCSIRTSLRFQNLGTGFVRSIKSLWQKPQLEPVHPSSAEVRK